MIIFIDVTCILVTFNTWLVVFQQCEKGEIERVIVTFIFNDSIYTFHFNHCRIKPPRMISKVCMLSDTSDITSTKDPDPHSWTC
jgi:hypothetical protein